MLDPSGVAVGDSFAKPNLGFVLVKEVRAVALKRSRSDLMVMISNRSRLTRVSAA
jgi:hypothetical protein